MFDPSAARTRLARLWDLEAHFGMELGATRVFLDEIVSDFLIARQTYAVRKGPIPPDPFA